VGYLAHLLISVGKPLALFAWLLPAATFITEKRSHYVRFHAAQAFALNRDGLLCWLVIGIVRDQLAKTSLTTSSPAVVGSSAAALVGAMRPLGQRQARTSAGESQAFP